MTQARFFGHKMHTNLGTILVLIGTILFGLALFFGVVIESGTRRTVGNFLLAGGGFLIGLGVLLGAAPLHVVN